MLVEKLRDLDKVLTGKSNTHRTTTEDDLIREIASGQDVVWYLSDGGYSRVYLNPVQEEIQLTSNSREEVKKAWEDASDQIEAVENALSTVIVDILDE